MSFFLSFSFCVLWHLQINLLMTDWIKRLCLWLQNSGTEDPCLLFRSVRQAYKETTSIHGLFCPYSSIQWKTDLLIFINLETALIPLNLLLILICWTWTIWPTFVVKRLKKNLIRIMCLGLDCLQSNMRGFIPLYFSTERLFDFWYVCFFNYVIFSSSFSENF